MKYTPPPWEATEHEYGDDDGYQGYEGLFTIDAVSGLPLAKAPVLRRCEPAGVEVRKGNVRLMINAPRMFEALQHIANYDDEVLDQSVSSNTEATALYAQQVLDEVKATEIKENKG